VVAPVPFRSITSAPVGVAIDVLHGKPQAVALAEWDEQRQVWIRLGDPERRALRRVTGWRRAAKSL
jgi:hypothetical protein